ncbi:hypothetical protein [Streptosporangium vulgare]|uniref:Uncharacterized protein n=1 Tax=Streptosporangium vulgare TaxID=46190 RepID=A0ABV5TQX2_9ACTN
MSTLDRKEPAQRCPAALTAERLRIGLEHCGIAADVHQGHGVALLSVWTNLVVWTDGLAYRWWTGKISAKTGRLYRVYGVDNPITVAHRVAQRCEELRKASHWSKGVAERTS